MKPAIHYLLTAAWGLATPALMGWGAQTIIEFFTSEEERMGHSTPVEFLLLFGGIGVLCLGVFLVYDFAAAVFFLPEDGKRTRRFFLALLLYFFVAVFGWIALALLETWVLKFFS